MSIPGFGDPSRWCAGEFARAEIMLGARGICCNASETGLTAEFAREPDAVSALFGDRTSLLHLDSRIIHPTAGNGLSCWLKLPDSGDAGELVEVADKLNHLDIYGVDTPPGFGAWSYAPEFSGLAYTGFWPNCMYVPGSAANLAVWCLVRSRIARQLIANQGTGH